jgi:site-specific DNA-methyltransferase (adenine-specific)
VTPYYEDGGITIWHADCRDVLPLIPAGSVDLVLTDPPYGVDIAAWDRRTPHEALDTFLRITSGAVVWFGAAPQLRMDLGAFDPAPERVLIWAPTFNLSHTAAKGIFYRWHPIYCWRIPAKHDGPHWDLLTVPTETGHRNFWHHPATKPVNLMRQLAGFSPSNGLILDPFMGSGTTLRAAKDLGRKAVGIEIEERYCEIAARRLAQAVLPLEVPA